VRCRLLKENDKGVLMHLRRNAREYITNIAKATGIPATTIYDRLKHQEDSFIEKYVPLITYPQLGFHSRLSIAIQCSRQDRQKLQTFLMEHTNVNSLHRINHGYDFLCDLVFRNIKDTEEFKEVLLDRFRIEKMHTFNIVDVLKSETFLTEPHHFDI
jgi:DNA-binding Lrp family transcriptional regulator